MREGKGTYYFDKENNFSGHWKNNVPLGDGVLTQNGEKKLEGEFRYGKFIREKKLEEKKVKKVAKNINIENIAMIIDHIKVKIKLNILKVKIIQMKIKIVKIIVERKNWKILMEYLELSLRKKFKILTKFNF